jgi:hypothetical protein
MIRHSGQDDSPSDRDLLTDQAGELAAGDNLAFFAAALERLHAPDVDLGAGGTNVVIGLVGQRDLPGVALRRAQAPLRWDRRPSLWSHAFLLVDPPAGGDAVARTPVREVVLLSRSGLFPEPEDNAVSDATLATYASREIDANVALVAISMSAAEGASVRERATVKPNLDRLRYDFFATLGVWQSWLWTRGTANPLEAGFPLYSSAFVEYCFEGIPLDMSPGASDRNSAPEHLWNAARHWSKAFEKWGHPISYASCIRDPDCAVLSREKMQAAQKESLRAARAAGG